MKKIIFLITAITLLNHFGFSQRMHEKYTNDEILKLSNYILVLEVKLAKFDSIKEQLSKTQMNYNILAKNYKALENTQKLYIDSLEQIIATKNKVDSREPMNTYFEITDEDKLVEKQMIEYLQKIKFEVGSYTLKNDLYFKLEIIADVLKKFKTTEYEIIGYADTTGSLKYNLYLSKMRALTVKSYLVSRGIDASRLKVIAKGEEIPQVSNSIATNISESRRAEIRNLKNKPSLTSIKK